MQVAERSEPPGVSHSKLAFCSRAARPDSAMAWSKTRRKSIFHSRAFQIGAVVVLLLVVGIAVLGPRGMRRYDRWSATRHVRRAAEFFAKHDFEHAALDARSALQLNPLDVEAMRVMARSVEAMHAPSAVQWRQRVDSLGGGDVENTLAWATDALAAGDADTAEAVLGKLEPVTRTGAPYHDLMARIAIGKRDTAGAETHWAEAVELDPQEQRYRLNLATLQAQSGSLAAREGALEVLTELSTTSDKRMVALRALLGAAISHRDGAKVKELADALASDPQATFADKLTRLTALRALQAPEATGLLLELRDGAMSKPGNLYALLTWMNGHDLALMVAEWAKELPPEFIAKPPVCISIAEARERGLDWERLEEMTDAGSWGEFDHLREAYLARAMEKLRDPNRAEKAWGASLLAAGTRVDALDRLVKMALAWGWERRAEDALWKLSATNRCPRWARDKLWAIVLKRKDTVQLHRVAKLMAAADPLGIGPRNDAVFLGLLTRSTDGTLDQRAEALHKEAPDNADVAATYGLSLCQSNRTDEAIALMETIAPEQLRRPGVARYYGIFLAKAGRGGEAAEFLKLGAEGFLLPEETVLIEQAKASTSRTHAVPLRQPDGK